MLRIAKRKGDKVRFAELLKVNVEAGEEGEVEEEEGVVDRPTQLICTSDIYLYVNRQIQKT